MRIREMFLGLCGGVSLVVLAVVPIQAVEYEVDEFTVILCHFNNNLINVATGERGEMLQGMAAEFIDGKEGKGIHLKEDQVLRFPLSDKFNKNRSTVEMWLKPNWLGDAKLRRTMFMLKGPGGWNQNAIGLYKNLHHEVALIVFDREGKSYSASVPTNIFQKDVWVHLAVMWDNQEGLKFFVNGELRAEKRASWEIEEFTPYLYLNTFSTRARKGSWHGDAVFDELRVSNVIRVRD